MLPPEGLAAPPALAIVGLQHSNEKELNLSATPSEPTLVDLAAFGVASQNVSMHGLFAIARQLKKKGIFDDNDIGAMVSEMRKVIPLPTRGDARLSDMLTKDLVDMHEALLKA